MPRIDPVSLQLFLAAAREGSIKRAADTEHIAQSALSRRLADLEHALGVPLLIRSPLGVSLTEAGQRAYSLGNKLNEDMLAFAREVQSFSGVVAGTVRLFANPSSIVGFLPERLQAFRAKHPGVEVALQERHTDEVLRACLDDRADLGIGVAVAAPRGIESWHFADDPLIVVLPLSHPLAKQRAVRYADVLKCPLVAIQSGGSLDAFLYEQAEALRMPYKPVVAVTSFDAACRMVEAGLGIAVMTASAVSAYAGTRRFVRRPLAEAWKQRELRVYALRKSTRLRAVEALIEALTA
jgi:DNA-binding transcriptional LysR family regulator